MNNKSIVITGGTRGIGYGLAKHFLLKNNNVCITGRSQSSIDSAVSKLRNETNHQSIIGLECDVSDIKSMKDLWNFTQKTFGQVDIWINNAGIANIMNIFEDIPKEEYDLVISSNITGTLNGCKVALREMKEQGYGQIYNFEGFGSDGRTNIGLSVYGMTKRAISYFTAALIKENENEKINVGYLSPGIVITDMITQEAEHMTPEKWAATKRMYNILGDDVETVTNWLTEATLNDIGKHGTAIKYLTPQKALWRFFKAYILHQKRDLFSEN